MANKSRDKESDRESSDTKKHRKTNAISAAEVPPSKLVKTDVYAVSIE